MKQRKEVLTEETLRNGGLKKTIHRMAVINYLLAVELPITVEQIYRQLNEKGHQISLSTTYRMVETLTRKGIVQKTYSSRDKKSMFLFNRGTHVHHFICLACHQMIEIKNCPLVGTTKVLEKEMGLVVTGHQLEMVGYCATCAKRVFPSQKEGK